MRPSGLEVKCGWEGAGFQSKPMILIEGGNRRIWGSTLLMLAFFMSHHGPLLPFLIPISYSSDPPQSVRSCAGLCFLGSACCSVCKLPSQLLGGGLEHWIFAKLSACTVHIPYVLMTAKGAEGYTAVMGAVHVNDVSQYITSCSTCLQLKM